MTMKKVFALIGVLLVASSSLKAQSGQIQAGSVIKGADGKPAGIVFQYDEATATGYMVSLVDTVLPWGDLGINIERSNDYINSDVASRDFTGLVNTAAIVYQLGQKTKYAARWCFELNAGRLSGWYLPSSGELNELLAQRQVVNQALEKAGATRLAPAWHWTSSEGDADLAWNINFSGGDNYPADKNAAKHVRAIRKF
jgi:hypothetical protein